MFSDVALDNVVDNKVSSLSESKTITVNNSNKNTYFDDSGLTDEVSDGDTLNFDGEISDFNFVVNKDNIVISGNEGNKLTNCFIEANVIEGLTIAGLNFDNTNIRNVISLTNPSNTNIINNNIVVKYDDGYSDYDYSSEAIIIWTGGENVVISNNTINMTSIHSSMYHYAIDLVDCDSSYTESGNHISYIISNNDVYVYSENTCPYGIYLAGAIGTEANPFVVENNTFDISSNASSANAADAYGISISGESWTGIADTEYIIIRNNDIKVSGNNMVYGINDYAGHNLEFSDNDIIVLSTAGAYGIGAKNIDNALISGNYIEIVGGDYSSISTYDYVGVGLAPIYCGSSDVNCENNNFIITEENYNIFFNNEGKLTDLVNDGDVLIFNMVLNNKDLTLEKSITFDGNGIGAIIGGTLYINGENIKVSNLLINNINKNGILVKEGSSDIEISNNNVIIVGVNAGAYDSYMAIATIGGVENIKIIDNAILF